MTAYLFVLAVGLVAGVVSGVIGTGSSLMLMPVLVYGFGPKRAIPVMAIAALMANVARIAAWWRDIDWRACAAYAATGVPAAALGARTMLQLPSRAVDLALGLFFLAMIPLRRWQLRAQWRLGLRHLALAGALIGFLTGVVLSTGPLSVPLFVSYGLAKGAFIGTEAAGSMAMYLSKIATFQALGALPLEAWLQGAIVGASLMAGTFAGRSLVLRMDAQRFYRLLEGLMAVSGLALLWAALG